MGEADSTPQGDRLAALEVGYRPNTWTGYHDGMDRTPGGGLTQT